MITGNLSRREWLRWTGAAAAALGAPCLPTAELEPDLVVGLGDFGAWAQWKLQAQFPQAGFWVFHDRWPPPNTVGHARLAIIEPEVIVARRANIMIPEAVSRYLPQVPAAMAMALVLVELDDPVGGALLAPIGEQVEDRSVTLQIRYSCSDCRSPTQSERILRVLADTAGLHADWQPWREPRDLASGDA